MKINSFHNYYINCHLNPSTIDHKMSFGNGASQMKMEPLDKLSQMHRVSMATNWWQPLGTVTLKKLWKLISYQVIDMPRGMGGLRVKKSENCPEARNNEE